MLRRLLTGLFLGRLKTPRDAARWAFRQHAAKTAILTIEGRRTTFAELGARVYALAAGMLARGLAPGDRVAFTLPNVPEFVELRLACHEAGLVAVPLIWDLPAMARAEAFAATEARLYVFDPELDPAPAAGSGEAIPVSELGRLARSGAGPCSVKIDPLAPGTINFTSGTTGSPKGVVSTHAAYIASLRMMAAASRLAPRDGEKFLHAVPLATAGWGPVLPCLMGGVTSLLVPRWEPAAAFDFAAREAATRTFLTPSQIIDWLDEPGLGGRGLPALRAVIYGTAPLSGPKAAEALARLGPVLQQGYGLAEVLPPLALLWPEEHDPAGHPFRAGRVARGVAVRIVDASGREVPRGERGAVEVRSPTQTPGYWRRPDLTAAAVRDGFFRTGDIGFWEEGGLLDVVGRAAESLPGFPLHPREVEEAAHAHPAVKECALVAAAGGPPTLAYSLRRGRELGEAELADFLAGRLPAGARPANCVCLASNLPRSVAGKIVRGQVQAALARP